MAVIQAHNGHSDIRFDIGSAEAAIRDMQRIGRAAVDAFLTGKKIEVLGGFPGLCGWLWTRSDQSKVVSRGLRVALEGMPFSTPQTLSPVGGALLAGSVPPRRVDMAVDRLRSLWRRLMRRAEGGAAPGGDLLAEALITTAYGDAGFRLDVAGALRRSLRSRVLFDPDGPPTAVPEPATVAALAVVQGLPETLPPEVVSALRKAAGRMLCAAGWAGFWDVWMLHEAVRTSASAPLRGMLELAGFAKRVSEDQDGDAEATEPAQMRPGWRAGCPGFAKALLNGTI
ncbi:MAG TPA: hypothetical protein DEA05_00235 [Rhodobacteraceae bacterium]|nr:hypothetical protein [Paracoccaceae bacterium]